MMQTEYVNEVRLLLQVLPSIFESGHLALKGGTAINLYLDDMPRLSVDIDAVFLPIGITRDKALLAINDEVSKIAHTSEDMGLRVHRTAAEDVNESQLFITNASTQVKVEINTVFRGSVLEPKFHSLNPVPSEMFAIDVPAMLLDPAEIYAGKALASLDRQHPRDLFDIWRLYQRGGLNEETLAAFTVYLCGHNRPPNEILGNSNKNIDEPYRNSLVGMIRTEAPTIDELVDVRENLRRDIIAGLSEASRSFIISFFSGSPQWDLLPFDHLDELPALQWKLHNLARFKVARPEELARQNRELKSLLT
mgnify:FL=1